jgi:hypothetical protein
MTLEVTGPRAKQFVDLLNRYSGLKLVFQDGPVVWSINGLIDPFESSTLQDLVFEILHSTRVVEVTAFGGRPAMAGLYLDTFGPVRAVQRPRRSVYVRDFDELEKLSPTLARAMMGHVLMEYFGAARPPGEAPSSNYKLNHVPAIRTEAQIVSDLTGRPIWEGKTRPWEAVYGTVAVRSYGPDLKYQLVFDAGFTQVQKVIPPKGL